MAAEWFFCRECKEIVWYVFVLKNCKRVNCVSEDLIDFSPNLF